MRLQIDTWRWAGVPFYIRAGKRLPVTATEVMAELRRPPQTVFDDIEPGDSNYFRFLLSPDFFISASARFKKPGEAMAGISTTVAGRLFRPLGCERDPGRVRNTAG